MKKIVSLFFVLIFIQSCSKKDNQEANVHLVEQYVQAVENLDHDIMESLLADTYIGYGPSYGDSINKVDAIANWKKNVENLYENITYNKSRIFPVSVPDGENKGEWVSNWAELHIKYKEDFKEVNIWANSIYKIENGKIVKSFTFYNEADALEQLGYLFVYFNDL